MARKTAKKAPRPTEAQLAAAGKTMNPPALVVWRMENLWTSGNERGVHVYELEMRLESEEVYGPQYRFTGRVIFESGRPPSGAREPASCAGCSWAYLPEAIREGKIRAVAS